MKKFILVVACLATLALVATSYGGVIDVSNLTIESRNGQPCVDVAQPRFSWINALKSGVSAYNKSQTAYQILVASDPDKLTENAADMWNSGKTKSDQSVFVSYEGAPLKSLTKYYWKVRTWDEKDAPSDWSQPAAWIQGVVDSKDWKGAWIGQPSSVRPDVDLTGANWIAAAAEKETNSGSAPEYFRREFTIDRPQADFDAMNFSGILYYAANQKFEIYVNGSKAGHSIGMVFNPDQLRSIDVSEYLVPGKNVVAFIVSNDTKNSNNTKANDGTYYPTALVAKLVVNELDKTRAPKNLPTPNRFGVPKSVVATVGTDETWKATIEPTEGWNKRDYDDSSWATAKYASFVSEDGKDGLDAAPWGKLRRRTETISPAFQKTFAVDKKVKSATLLVCAAGLFEPYLDGQKIGDQVLAPSFTRYDKRVLYNVFDLTNEFASSDSKEHELQFLVGHSWYDVRSIVTWNFDAAPWRDFPRMRAQLELTFEDGSRDTIATDGSWTYSTSPVLFDCVRQGEIVDGSWKREILGAVEVVSEPIGNPKLVAQKNPDSVVTDEYVAKSVTEVRPNVYVVDMGRNCAGWAKIRITGQEPGDVVRFKYSERVVGSGEIERHDIEMHFMEGTPARLTGMKGEFQTDFYFCNGEKEEFFEPRFTYNGYQYIEVTGLRHKPEASDFVGKRVNTNFEQVGEFESSNALLNSLQAATLESYRNNFVAGYPTDCPHREKNGWTGDAQLACELSMYNFENTASYEKWLDDLVDEQREDGNLPGIVPTGDWGYPWGNGPAWDSSLVMIPWYAYVYRGDKKILEDTFEAMKKYVDYMTSRERPDGLVAHGLGDWVYPKTNTPTEVTSTGYYYLDTKITAQTAKILGKLDDYEKYSKLAERIRTDYNKVLYKGNGVYSIGSQTSQSCPIHQGFAQALPKEDYDKVVDRLVDAIAKTDGTFDAGILGVKYLLRTLSENGRTDLALQLMLQEKRPAMSDWIKRGAGTLWEDWGEGSSRNHIMFGDFSAWFYQSLAGIKLAGAPDVVVASEAPTAVAFKNFVIEPKSRAAERTAPGHEPLTYVSANVRSPYGTIASSWKYDEEAKSTTYVVDIPVGTSATVIVPVESGQSCSVVSGEEYAANSARQENDGYPADAAIFFLRSGSYSFVVK